MASRRGAFICGALLALAACGRSNGEDADLQMAARRGGDSAPQRSRPEAARPEQRAAAAPDQPRVADTLVVYKTAACGCCKAWIEHMEQNGFVVAAHDESLVELNRRKGSAGVGSDLLSCHTALVGGYVVEGHVPADLVKRMLRERPQITGLAVPGMPIGSPGMGGTPKQKYDVIAFRRAGAREVYDSR